MSITSPAPPLTGTLDARGRPLADLRISLTDRCNFRCTYCMPEAAFPAGHRFLAQAQLLSAAEIERLVAAALRRGVRKVRLTGGEPLLRSGVVDIVRAVAATGVEDLAMTTNGSLLARFAAPLHDAGLRRLAVSLDSLDDATVTRMSGGRARLADILAGIAAAERAGLAPLKLNCVVRRGVNDGEVLRLAAFARSAGHIMRFIEYMDVGTSNGWRLDEVVPATEIVATLDDAFGVSAAPAGYAGEVAQRYRYDDGGEVGVIASVSNPFCGDCTRLRVSADGHLFTCLFASAGTDVRPVLRHGSENELDDFLAARWGRRNDAYSEHRAAAPPGLRRIEMSYIGG